MVIVVHSYANGLSMMLWCSSSTALLYCHVAVLESLVEYLQQFFHEAYFEQPTVQWPAGLVIVSLQSYGEDNFNKFTENFARAPSNHLHDIHTYCIARKFGELSVIHQTKLSKLVLIINNLLVDLLICQIFCSKGSKRVNSPNFPAIRYTVYLKHLVLYKLACNQWLSLYQ